MNLEQEWIEFLAELFEREGWEVYPNDGGSSGLPDLALSQRGVGAAVELKLVRSSPIASSLIQNATLNLLQIMRSRGADQGFLVIPQEFGTREKIFFRAVADDAITLWDRDRLINHVRNIPTLARRLSDLLRALQIGAESSAASVAKLAVLEDIAPEPPPAGEGERLATALEDVEPGSKDGAAQRFEKLCEEALILLFGEELIGWKRQSAIENGYQRVDLIARLQPVRSAFWTTLATDFRARYIVFEFKNYTDPIGQEQIYSTERYLYATALRSVAIVVARNGFSDNAKRTVQGALREQGKLILCLDLKQFCEMLRAFDTGDDYETILLARRDELLMSLAR